MDCPAFYPQQVCSGHGFCQNITGLCVCDDGWSSIGDYSTRAGQSCSINITAIKALWIIEEIASIGLLIVTSKYLFKYYSMKSDIGKKSFNIKDPLVVFPLCFWLESIMGIILGIIKASDPEYFAIALNPLSSVLFGLFYITGVHGCCAYMYVLIKFIAGYARMMSSEAREYISNESKILKKWSVIVAILIVPVCIIPLISIAVPGHDREAVAANLVSFAFIATFLIGVCVRYLSIIISELEKHLSESEPSPRKVSKYADVLYVVKLKLSKVKRVMSILGPSSIVTFGTLAAWELLSRNTSYLWPLQLAATDAQFIPIILSLMSKSEEDKDTNITPTTGSKGSKNNLFDQSPGRKAIDFAITPNGSVTLTPSSPDNKNDNNNNNSLQYILSVGMERRNSSNKVAPYDLEEES